MFILYLKERNREIFVFFLFCAVFLVSFLLYHLPAGAVLYPAALCVLTGMLLFFLDFRKLRRRHEQLEALQGISAELLHSFPPACSIESRDYQEIIRSLCEEQKARQNQADIRYSDMVDYYTTWAHQIKTPIASMRLRLQKEDSPLARQLTADLFRIEQYVEMALMFLKLDSGAVDYVIREYELDSIVRQAVKKFVGEFIERKLRLEYNIPQVRVITDEKWLSFVIEQVLSNSLKYTQAGGIEISLEAPGTLCVRDTGIGIAPEDLPRIFEKGYTGYNGRSDKKASGIGLYLCRRICRNLGHGITAQSDSGGTVIRIDLAQKKAAVE